MAAFHLDKLAAEGLAKVAFRRLSGRGGPRAGRPSKVYRRPRESTSVSLPHEEYRLAAELLIRAVDVSGAATGRLMEEASSEGRAVGRGGGRSRPHQGAIDEIARRVRLRAV